MMPAGKEIFKTENNYSSRGILMIILFKQTLSIHLYLDNEGEENSDIDTFEGDELKKILQSSPIESDLVFYEEEAVEAEEADSDRLLLIPLFALSFLAGVTLTLATFRLFYCRFF